MTDIVSNRAQILLVEDDHGIADILSMLLSEKYKVTVPDNYNSLLPLIKDYKYDLVLLDLSVWGRDGALLCKKIKSDSINNNTPVILLSANPDTRLIAKSLGADDVIEKPFDLDVLTKTVNKFLPISSV